MRHSFVPELNIESKRLKTTNNDIDQVERKNRTKTNDNI